MDGTARLWITGGMIGLICATLMMLFLLAVVLLDSRHWAETPDAELDDLLQ